MSAIFILCTAYKGGFRSILPYILNLLSSSQPASLREVRSAVLNSPRLSTLSESNTKLLKMFLEDPADYYDKKAQAKASSAKLLGRP